MKNRRFPAACLSLGVAVLLASPAATAPQQEQIDLDMVAKIRAEGLERSRVWASFSELLPEGLPRQFCFSFNSVLVQRVQVNRPLLTPLEEGPYHCGYGSIGISVAFTPGVALAVSGSLAGSSRCSRLAALARAESGSDSGEQGGAVRG